MSAIPKPNHMSAGFLFRVVDGVFEVLMVPQTYRDGNTDWKPPCGTNEEYDHDTPEDTLEREVRDEAGLVVISALPLQKAKKSFPAQPEKNRGAHDKNWFLVTDWDGELRTKDKMDGPDNLGIPEWVPVAEAYGRLSPNDRRIIRSHQEALNIAVQMFLTIYGHDKDMFRAIESAVPGRVLVA